MQNRLYQRYVKLKARGKTETKIIVAIARELSAFLWELQTKLNLPIPGPAPAHSVTTPTLKPQEGAKNRPSSDELGNGPFSLARFFANFLTRAIRPLSES